MIKQGVFNRFTQHLLKQVEPALRYGARSDSSLTSPGAEISDWVSDRRRLKHAGP